MKKISVFILSVFCALSAVFLSACNEQTYSLSFSQDYIEMKIGEEFNVSSKVIVEQIDKKELTYKSLDSNIVVVLNGVATAMAEGTTFVKASYKNSSTNIEVKVIGENISASTPQGLTYDSQNGYITWNKVLIKLSTGIKAVNSYTLEIIKGETTEYKQVVGDNKLYIPNSGEYTVKVRADSLVSNGQIIYEGSDYSAGLKINKLASATNLKYNDETNTLSWDCDSTVSQFQVKINGVLSKITTEKSMVVSLIKVDATKQENFDVSVVSVSGTETSTEDVVMVNGESETKTYKRLFAPTLKIVNGVITWDNTQSGNFHYIITRTYGDNVSSNETVTGGEYTLANISAGQFNEISIKAVSDDNIYLSSKNESKLTNIVKLASTTLSFNPSNLVVSASEYENKYIELHITYQNKTEKITMENGSYTFDKKGVGTYEIKAYIIASTDSEINADASNTIKIIRLEDVDNNSVIQSSENNRYGVKFNEIVNANLYELSYRLDNGEIKNLIKQQDGTFGDIDTLFNVAGTYTVYIKASSTQDLGSDTFVLSSTISIQVVRQNVLVVNVENNEGKPSQVNWDSIATATSYAYKVFKDSNAYVSGNATTNSFSLQTFEFGNYSFFVKANGGFVSGVLYLDSLDYTKVDFAIDYTLVSPELNFNRETKVLTVNKVENAINYTIKLNGVDLIFDNTQDKITIDLSSKIITSGEYIISVVAVNNDNELIYDSNPQEIIITKLASPKKLNLTSDGLLIINDYPNSSMLAEKKESIKIGEIETATLPTDSSSFAVKVMFNARQDKVGNKYYLDSDYSTLQIERLATPNAPTLNDSLIEWTENSFGNFNYLVKIIQDDTLLSITTDTNSIDVFDQRLATLNLEKDFSVSVSYVFVGMILDLETSTTYKFSSFVSQPLAIHKIQSDIALSVVETDGTTNVSWTSSEIENVRYELFINDISVYSGDLLTFDATSQCALEGTYTIKLKISKEGYLTSEFAVVEVVRLTGVGAISIDEHENIVVSTPYSNGKEILVPSNGQYVVETLDRLEKISITSGIDSDITNLSSYIGKFSISVQLVAKKYTSGKYYFLSSPKTTFSFSRISTLTSPVTANNAITWDTIENVSSYRLKFTDGVATKYFDIEGNSVQTNIPEIQDIVSQLDSQNIKISVMGVIGQFEAQKDIEHMLSSAYSAESNLIKLANVENITITTVGDFTQSNILISWTHTSAGNTNQYEINVYKNSILDATYTISGTLNSYTIDNGFSGVGDWYVEIKALGVDNSIDSDFVKSNILKRITAPIDLSITTNSVLSWTGVQDALGYVVSYYYNDSINGFIENIDATNYDMSSILFANDFAGEIQVKVIALGGQGLDENMTLSSPYSEVLTVNKTISSTVRMSPSYLTAGGFEQDSTDTNSTYIISVYTQGRLVKTIETTYGEKYMFENWKYQDNQTYVPTNVDMQFTFKIQRLSNVKNSIPSDMTTKVVVKLAEMQNLGIKKATSDINSNYILQSNIVENANRYIVVFTESKYSTDAMIEDGTIAYLTLTNEIYSKMDSDWSLTAYAVGSIGEKETDYINSATVSLSGKKLEQVSSFGVKNGELTWDYNPLSVDYALKVSDGKTLTGYISNGIVKTTENLVGYSGDLSANIKSVGNVGTTLLKKDIVLDSSYFMDETYNYKDFAFSKLSAPTNFKVMDGYLSVEDVEGATAYSVISGSNIYGTQIVNEKLEGFSKLYSPEMYDSFKTNTIYNVALKAISDIENVLYSDVCASLRVKILENKTQGTLKISLKVKSTEPIKLDYTVSELTWSADANATNGYLVNLKNDITKTMATTFVLDNGSLEGGSSYSVKVAICGSSEKESDDSYYLNSRYSEELSFAKLNTPGIQIVSGVLSWASVNDATGYLIYLDGALFNEEPLNTTTCVVNLGDISANKNYNKVEVRAISTNTTSIASDLGVYGTAENNIKVIKLAAPKKFEISNGSFKWTIGTSYLSSLIGLVGGSTITAPFTTSMQTIENDYINFKFVSSASGLEYVYKDYAVRYCELTQDVKNLITNFAPDYDLSILTYNGWPTMSHSFIEMADNLPAGAYTVYIRQLGNDLDRLTSNYGSSTGVYVPFAPQVELIYSNNEYKLNWNAISVPASYNMSTINYVVVGEKLGQDGKTEYVNLGETANTNFNLTTLVNSDVLNTSFNKVYVYVKGDSDKVLNGKVSNQISIKVLDKITAYVHDGELYWNAQDGVSEYQVTYTEATNSESVKNIILGETSWNCADLSSSVSAYNVSIKAVGTKISSKVSGTITGKDTSVGQITKLITPNTSVDNGVFVWNLVDNSSSYRVAISNADGIVVNSNVANIPSSANRIEYESDRQFIDGDLSYEFISIGDIDTELSSSTLAYVNSNKTTKIHATVLNEITNVVAKEGKLTWEILVNNNVELANYKIMLAEIDSEGNVINHIESIYGSSYKDNSLNGLCSYSCQDITSGLFRVNIQSYYSTSDRRGQYDDGSAYYLISAKSADYDFEKLNKVQGVNESGVVPDNIVIKDGVLSWEYSGEIVEDVYRYELTFSSLNGETYTILSNDNSYSGNVVDQLVYNYPFTIKLRVIPQEKVIDYVNGDSITFKNVNDAMATSQLNGISEDEIALKKMGQEEELYISWENHKVSAGVSDLTESLNVKYEIDYWTSQDKEIKTKTVRTKYISTAEFEFNINDEFTLFYRIRVIPLGTQNYLSSSISATKEIQKPQSVENVYYNATEQYFYWANDGVSVDHTFKIKDEILQSDENGQLVLDQQGLPVVARTYFFTTQNSLQNKFIPLEVGIHKVSVAVVVKNSQDEGSLTSSYIYYYDSVLDPDNKTIGTNVAFNMFSMSKVDETTFGALGTTTNPYVIKTASQFAKIDYRVNKLVYENIYILRTSAGDQRITNIGVNTQFSFIQANDLTGVAPLGQVSSSLYADTTSQFYGIYNGNYYATTWNYSLGKFASNAYSNVSLFGNIATSAVVKNMNIKISLTNSLPDSCQGATISLVANENNGTIENVIIGSQGAVISLPTTTLNSKNIYFYGIATTNKGTITKCVNKYSFELANNTSATVVDKMGFAGIVGTNIGTVLKCAMYGKITLQSTSAPTCGGIVGQNKGGTIKECVLKNTSTTLRITKDQNTQVTVAFRFGGIAGYNDGGNISYSYVNTNMSIVKTLIKQDSASYTYIGGLVGLSSNALINSSYVNALINLDAKMDIGTLNQFTQVSASSGTGDKCYSNENGFSIVGGLGASALTVLIASNPSSSDLNGTEQNYTTNEVSLPTLEWESSFVSEWTNPHEK